MDFYFTASLITTHRLVFDSFNIFLKKQKKNPFPFSTLTINIPPATPLVYFQEAAQSLAVDMDIHHLLIL